MAIVPVILCGGAGSRLWPISREEQPKPFIRLKDGQSLLQKAFLHALSLDDVQEILIVANHNFVFNISNEINEINTSGITVSYLIEPCAKNTAAAVIMAALSLQKHHKLDTAMLILAADHIITKPEALQDAVNHGLTLATANTAVTFGIKPNHPHTGYGYIEADKHNKVLRFIEKPDLETATKLVKQNNFLWNSGMFLFSLQTIMQEFALHSPEILKAAERCLNKSTTYNKRTHLEAHSFNLIPENSLDYAIMEKSHNLSVIPCDLGWSDIGSWRALEELVPQDDNGNRIEAETLLHNVKNCYIKSEKRLIAGIGLDNLLIIDTPDALLIADKNCDQEVKNIYSKLKQNSHAAHKTHVKVIRPWGSFTVLETQDCFKIKRIEVKPQASLSLQMHHHRNEHWIVVSGTAKVTNGEETILVKTNESTYIEAGKKHRVSNPGILPLIIIEVQSGAYLGEDDIIRYEDAYERV
jgi:mannose-1-phosphate guanylyltransferase / mannose-6-phosphate isomerase